MTIVVDSSVLVAAVVDAGREGAWAEDVVAHRPLAAPQLILAEATNILRRLERAKRLTALEAAASREDILKLEIAELPFHPFADRIWALRGNFTCYDAWYVSVAEALDAPLATLDRRLSRATGHVCRFLFPPERR